MIITSVFLLVTAFVFLVLGAFHGDATVLGLSLGAAGAGALSLLAGTASARRAALARGVPVEAILAGRFRRAPLAPGKQAASPTPPPIDGYDDMPASEVRRLVSSGALADDHLSEMLVYEASHRRRRVVLTAILDATSKKPVRESEGGTAQEPASGTRAGSSTAATETVEPTR